MEIFFYPFIFVYFTILSVLAVFGIHRYYLAYLYYRYKNSPLTQPEPFEALQEVPFVTVQLPIYNERYVLPRLLKAISKIQYPKDRLEIQLLDDSTDETIQEAERLVANYRKQGVPITLFHRKDRSGFKAGALEAGLQFAKGELIAIFDADFVPPEDFLKKMVPYFSTHPKIGMVQARWGHLNTDYSLLTQAQSIFLDGHFMIEHTARNRSGSFFNFNGTAGMWRRSCIEDAGGWQHDTLTEDLDLSYRAQMKGWQFIFVPDLVTPAELPVEVNAFKAQQHRWAKGSIQTAKKLIPQIVRSSIPFKSKIESIFHLSANSVYLMMVLLSLLMPFSIYFRYHMGWFGSLYIDLPLFLSATFSVTFFYAYSQKEIYNDWKKRLYCIPFNLAIGIGLSINNAKGVIEALIGYKTDFNRTPKYAIEKRTDQWKNKKYNHKISWITIMELLFGVYFSLTLSYVIERRVYVAIPFLSLFLFGYLYLSLAGIVQRRSKGKTLP